jgi:hypothetical protein
VSGLEGWHGSAVCQGAVFRGVQAIYSLDKNGGLVLAALGDLVMEQLGSPDGWRGAAVCHSAGSGCASAASSDEKPCPCRAGRPSQGVVGKPGLGGAWCALGKEGRGGAVGAWCALGICCEGLDEQESLVILEGLWELDGTDR